MKKTHEGIVELFGKVWNVKEITHKKLGSGIEIDFTAMFGVPKQFTYKNMFALAEFFGTQDIDWHNISNGGCDTCDYGSNYGFKIQIYNITQNLDKVVWE